MVTDYDVWADHPVTAEEVEKIMTSNVERARKILYSLIPKLREDPAPEKCGCCRALDIAIV